LIQYSFYKNIVLVGTQFWFTVLNGFSGQTLYEKWTLSLFNVFFALFPIVSLGVFDRDIGEKVVLANPQLYIDGQQNYLVSFFLKIFSNREISLNFHSFSQLLKYFSVPQFKNDGLDS
jgi:phospholipid-transporting ATPase